MQTHRFTIAAGLVVTAFFVACSSANNEPKIDSATEIADQRRLEGEEAVARGEYLLTIGGCNDCHTPKIFSPAGMSLDSSKLYAGHIAGRPLPSPDPAALTPGNWAQMSPEATAFVGPWGISYASNLTPDSATGIGAWSEEVFVKTMRTGRHLGMENGRPVLPPMPWYNLTRMKDEDLKAAYAYLRSLPPIRNGVPAPVTPDKVLTAKR